jgi:asparagine N-glycosylation enzyme membrane subunit Stt3
MHAVLAGILYALLLAIMAGLVWRTALGLRRSEICVPD